MEGGLHEPAELRSSGFISGCRGESAKVLVLEQGSVWMTWGTKISSGETEAENPAWK